MKPKATIPEPQITKKKTYQKPKDIKPEHQEFMINLGKELKRIRESKGLSISGLAKEVVISRNAYSQMEQGKVYYNFLNLLLVLDYHKKSANDFFKSL